MRPPFWILVAAAALAGGAAACAGDVDEAWYLSHDRVVAVRATPPHVPAGGHAVVDALLAQRDQATRVATPDVAAVVTPQSLAGALAPGPDGWTVTAPDEATLAATRTQLGLAADAPVPLEVGMQFAGGTLTALKTVWLGDTGDNPALDGMTIDGAPAGDGEVDVDRDVEVHLSVPADPENQDVNWLTSSGTMHDFDLPRAYLVVAPDDPAQGELAIVLRDRKGGVAWKVWPLVARPAPTP